MTGAPLAMGTKLPTVPAPLAAAVAGSWELGDGYRITLSRAGAVLRVRQIAGVRLRGRAERVDEVRWDPATETLHFPGLSAIHRTTVTLRWSPPRLQYSFSAEIAPGRSTQGTWREARRAAAR